MRQCSKCGTSKEASAFYARGNQCRECRCALQRAYARARADHIKSYREAHREQRNQVRRDWYRSLRDAALEAYGGRCRCCGETEFAFLTFDHVDGGGVRHRQQVWGGERGRGGHGFLTWLREAGYPPEIQVLCLNCNMAKHFNPGGCPHAGS